MMTPPAKVAKKAVKKAMMAPPTRVAKGGKKGDTGGTSKTSKALSASPNDDETAGDIALSRPFPQTSSYQLLIVLVSCQILFTSGRPLNLSLAPLQAVGSKDLSHNECPIHPTTQILTIMTIS
jgi:hypothetical protein